MWPIILSLLFIYKVFCASEPETSARFQPVSLGPGPFGPLENLNPPVTTVEETEKVYVPPDIR